MHKWSKPKGWTLAQVNTAQGPSSLSGDVVEAQGGSWAQIWDGEDVPGPEVNASLIVPGNSDHSGDM